MSTYASISMLRQDGTILNASVKYDGYIDGVGRYLRTYYTTESYVEELLSRGNMRTLGRSISGTEYYNTAFDGALVYDDWQDYEANCQTHEYNYMYCDGNWTVRLGNQRNFSSY